MEQIAKYRWFVRVAAAVICLALAISAGLLWQPRSEETNKAQARVVRLQSNDDESPALRDGKPFASEHEIVPSPEILPLPPDCMRDREIAWPQAVPCISMKEILREESRRSAYFPDFP